MRGCAVVAIVGLVAVAFLPETPLRRSISAGAKDRARGPGPQATGGGQD
jgi:hypothetical protein